MELVEVQFLLPCQELEDVALHREPREAHELLLGWTCLYHPALLAATGKLPRWSRADSPPGELAGRLVVVPGASHSHLPEGWLQLARSQAAAVIESYQGREDLLGRIQDAGFAFPQLREENVQDFFALGYCHLQAELLTRQLRYVSYLDSTGLEYRAVEAAKSLVSGDLAQARERLQRSFDILVEGREYFYPTEATLIDLVLVAPSTLGGELEKTLTEEHPLNLLIDGNTLRDLAECSPHTLELLRQRLKNGSACIVGGENIWEELPLLPVEELFQALRDGLATYRELLGKPPSLFGRRRFGLSPILPQILQSFGYRAALHFTLDDGTFPTSSQSRIRWEGIGPAVIDAVARVPLDASADETFLRFGAKAGEALDLDQSVAIIFAHWPGKVSPWFGDLKRVTSFSHVLGQFATLAEFLAKSYYAGQNRKYLPHEYRSPYLRQDVARQAPAPISSWVRRHRQHMVTQAQEAEWAVIKLLRANRSGKPSSGPAAQVLASLTGAGSESQLQGSLVLNPWSFPRLCLVSWPASVPLPRPGGPIQAAGVLGNKPAVLVQVPAMGFAWVGPDPDTAAEEKTRPHIWQRMWRSAKKSGPPLVQDHTLQNEFMQVRINPVTGAIRSIRSLLSGANALGAELALRLPTPEGPRAGDDVEAFYTLMACDGVEILSPGPVAGEVVTRGRLVTRSGRLVARYEQKLSLWVNRPWLEMDILLQPIELPQGDPWRHYYCVRFAWADATCALHAGIGWTYQKYEGDRIESPFYIDIRGERSSFTILCGGLPYHRPVDVRKLDTLLVVRGETETRFRIGIAADVPHPAEVAMDFLAPPPDVVSEVPKPRNIQGWFFHISARNVIATHWSTRHTDDGEAVLTVRLLETEGREGTLRLRCFRNPKAARKVNFAGETLTELVLEEDTVLVDIKPFEWCQVEVSCAV